MNAAILAIGSEMLGPTRVDTNSLKITSALESYGIALARGMTQAAPKVVPDRSEQRKRDKRAKKIDEEVAQLEARIAAAEAERERNDLLLCSQEVFRDGERVKKIQQQNHDLKAMIELLYGKWEALAKEKDELEGAPV